jgi:hypothetical protein
MTDMRKYSNPVKSTWRGWSWNQVTQRSGKSYSHSRKTVCVLAGDSAGDAIHAERHGVKCVAIDYDIGNVRTYRANGGAAIQDSLKNQLLAMAPDCVIADFVNGITFENLAIMIDSVAICDSVVFNFLRGRDPIGGVMARSRAVVPNYIGRRKVDETTGKHRGKLAALFIGWACAEMWYGIDREERFIPGEIFEKMRPSFYSYKSQDSGQYFDSIAITTKDFRIVESKEWVASLAPLASRRKAAAAKAVLTKLA